MIRVDVCLQWRTQAFLLGIGGAKYHCETDEGGNLGGDFEVVGKIARERGRSWEEYFMEKGHVIRF